MLFYCVIGDVLNADNAINGEKERASWSPSSNIKSWYSGAKKMTFPWNVDPTQLPTATPSVLPSPRLRRAMDFSFDIVSLSATIILGLLSLYCVLRIFRRDNSREKRYPPVVGTVFHQFLNFRRLHDYHTELSRKHKTFKLLAPFRQQIYTSDPTVVEYILKTNFPNYGKVRITSNIYFFWKK